MNLLLYTIWTTPKGEQVCTFSGVITENNADLWQDWIDNPTAPKWSTEHIFIMSPIIPSPLGGVTPTLVAILDHAMGLQ